MFNIPFSVVKKIIIKRISKDVKDLNIMVNKYNLVDIYRNVYSKTMKQTLFSSIYETFINEVDHKSILGHKANLKTNVNGLRQFRIYSITTMQIKLEISLKKLPGKIPTFEN